MSRPALQVLPDDDDLPSLDFVAQGESALAKFTDAGLDQHRQTLAYLGQLRDGSGAHVPWRGLDAHLGPLLPGWFVVCGARPKAGKTTMLLNLFNAWTEEGRRCLYLGTETGVEGLKISLACQRSGVEVDAYLEGRCARHEALAVEDDLCRQAALGTARSETALFADARHADIVALERILADAATAGCEAVLYDYLQRIPASLGRGGQEDYARVSEACTRLKNAAERHQMLVVAGAQLKVPPGITGEFEVPGNASWYMGNRPQQEADVAIQQWRPFKKGVTREEKQRATDGDLDTVDITQPGVMAVRVAAHRWKPSAVSQITRLRVTAGRIHDHREDYA